MKTAHLEKINSGDKWTLNPFDEKTQNENFCCLPTGKVTSDEVKIEPLLCVETGKKYVQEVTKECFADLTRFEKPIPCREVKDFSSGVIKFKLTVKDKKISCRGHETSSDGYCALRRPAICILNWF